MSSSQISEEQIVYKNEYFLEYVSNKTIRVKQELGN